ncbi:MAG: hypothetical protein C5B59_13995 [Bacteroidetes bacterium]|nr:MAG: hypothetical protein C5B59_13995 [Bacteroidota bacterium]
MKTDLKIFYDPNWGAVGSDAISGAAVGTSILPGWGTLAGGLVGGAIGLFTGGSQKKQGQNLVNQPYPANQVPEAIRENKVRAEAQANQGTPAAVMEQHLRDLREGRMTAMRYALENGGPNAAIKAGPSIQNQYDRALGNVYAQDASDLMRNRNTIYGVNNTLGAYQNNAWNWNYRDKYLRDYNYGMGLLGMGNANMMGGYDRIAAALTHFASTGGFNRLFGNSNGGGYAANPSDIGSDSIDLSQNYYNDPMYSSGYEQLDTGAPTVDVQPQSADTGVTALPAIPEPEMSY